MIATQQRMRGFTLIEVMVVSGIMGVVIGGAALFWNTFLNSYQFSVDQTRSLSIARSGVAEMVRELREARDGENGAYALAAANDTEVVFYSDVDNDDKTERVRYYLTGNTLMKQVFHSNTQTNYICMDECEICHQGSDTMVIPETAWPAHYGHGDELGACGSSQEVSQEEGAFEFVVAEHVVNTNPLFTYYNGDWPGDTANNPLTTGERLLNTRYIEVELAIQVSQGNMSPDVVTIRNGVHVRNLKDNL